MKKLLLPFVLFVFCRVQAQTFAWPHHKKATIVLTYGDALLSQLDTAVPQLKRAGLIAASPGRSFTDAAQLAWLEKDLAAAVNPVIVFMHQPVFLNDFFQEIGNADEILRIFDQANLAAACDKKNNRVVAVFMGHDHDDRYGERNGVHYFILNSATYGYTNDQAYYYRDALYAFVLLSPKGEMVVEGASSVFRPDRAVARFPTKISDPLVRL